jgi:hypothetical protein
VQRPNGKLRVGGVDQDGELDLGGRDGADVDALLGERLEGRAATPAWLRIPTPMADTLTTSVAPLELAKADASRWPCSTAEARS